MERLKNGEHEGKVAILSVTDIRHITMIKIYTDYFRSRNINYEIICSERYNDEKIGYEGVKLHLSRVAGHEASKARKLIDYLKFRYFALKVLQDNNYKYIVVWNELTMALFSDYLKNHGKYCANIRDITFSRLPFFRARIDQCVQNSDFSTWCAQRGVEYLPRHDYVIVLNQNKKIVEGAMENTGFKTRGDKIRIGVVGYIRHIEGSKEFMFAFCNDNRYILQFFGNGSEYLKDYAVKIGMKNIETEGAFRPEETAKFLDRMDVINAYIGDGKLHIEQALGSPIRYGYSTCLYKPAIVSPNTFLSEKTRTLNIAYTADDLWNLADGFYEWYHSLDFDEFKKGCDVYNHEFETSIKNLHKICDEKIYPVIKGCRYE